MRVILQENVANLGKVGDQVKVKPGYARNYLVPKGIAVSATKENIKSFEARRAELEKAAAERISAAMARAKVLASASVEIEVKTGDEGKLYGSVGVRDIAQAAVDAGLELAASDVLLPDGPIRQLGDYSIDLQLHSEVVGTLKVVIKPIE